MKAKWWASVAIGTVLGFWLNPLPAQGDVPETPNSAQPVQVPPMPTSVSSPPEQPAGPPPGHFSEPAPNSIDRWYKATGWVTATNIFSGLEHVSGPPSRFFLDAEFLL